MFADDICQKYPDLKPEDLRFLLSEILELPPSRLYSRLAFNDAQNELFESAIKRLQRGEPPQYIVNKAWFYGLSFYVDKRVLIPRFDSEVLVEALSRYIKGDEKVLEIGVGSAALSIALKKEYPALRMHGTDISEDALAVAKMNADTHGCDITFHHADLFPVGESGFDIVFSNPPYISDDEYQKLDIRVKEHEPKSALLAKKEGLEYYQRICGDLARYMNINAIVAFEHGFDQQERIVNLTESYGLKTLQMGKDLSFRDRFIIAKIIS